MYAPSHLTLKVWAALAIVAVPVCVGFPDILTYLARKYLVTLCSPTCLTLRLFILAAMSLVASSVPRLYVLLFVSLVAASLRLTTITFVSSAGAVDVARGVRTITVNPCFHWSFVFSPYSQSVTVSEYSVSG